MTINRFKAMLNEEYDIMTEDDRITQINTCEKVDYTPLEMRDDEQSFTEIIFQASKVPMGFTGRYAFLSNMAYAPFQMNGHWFLTAEHAFHFYKCKYANEAQQFDACNPDSIQDAYKAREAGRKVIMRDNWKDVRIRVMRAILWAKFEQNEDLMVKLLNTPGPLCEYNTWNDMFWGKCKKDGHWTGSNYLGKLLSDMRDDYYAEQYMTSM